MNLNLIDLTQAIAMLASFGGTSGALSFVRTLFLDQLLAGLSGTQQDYILRAVNYLLNFAAILGASLVTHEALSPQLLLSVAVAAWGAFGLSHMAYHLAVNTKAAAPLAEPSEIPVDGPGIPPTETPAAAALAA